MSFWEWAEHYRFIDQRVLILKILYNQGKELEDMGELQDALAREQSVIDEVVALVQSFGNFQAQLDAAQAALAALQTVDNQDKADLQAALDSAQAAVQVVSQQTGQLQALVPASAVPAPAESSVAATGEVVAPKAAAKKA